MNYSKMYDQNEFETQETATQVIEDIPFPDSDEKIGLVNYKDVYIRPYAGTTNEPLEIVHKNDELLILAEEGNWYKVITPTNTEGYIMSQFVDVN